MPSTLPIGDPVPADGSLPSQVRQGADWRRFGLYIHIPFCTVRCGYCDFNTYTQAEMPGVAIGDYHRLAISELDWAKTVMDRAGLPERPVSTVFFGGGTPSLMAPWQVESMLGRIGEAWGLAEAAEVTLEANPDSLDLERLDRLVAAGITRFSVGMQSARRDVLATLDRTHTPERVPEAVEAIRAAGADVSVDVIYGAPGETLEMWEETVSAVVALGVDHVSAYSLIVEPGTALHRRISRGELAAPSDDLHADMYEAADDALSQAGFGWYEVSNWSRNERTRSEHNLGYWRSDDWWGVGPGAHSHIGGVRWWNAKHPTAWAARLAAGETPAVGREVLDESTRAVEDVLLRLRTREGIPIARVDNATPEKVATLIADGAIDGREAVAGTLVLTRRGRLMADWVARQLTP
jgi:putative oxygen-independent coproporphyrinogen III oxidase